jgi:hypothetical protein
VCGRLRQASDNLSLDEMGDDMIVFEDEDSEEHNG